MKYVKSVGRVHNIHNDYIVALSEANLYQQHYANVLLPGLLEFHQRSQQALVQQWSVKPFIVFNYSWYLY